MFSGFNVTIDKPEIFTGDGVEYDKILNENTQIIHSAIDSCALDRRVLDATRIEKEWFPYIDADVFISHSHKDRDMAVGFAEWLYEVFGITSFIDSCVWGYADELLRRIDDLFCVNQRNSDGGVESYSYQKRNQSTAHVHMILNMALQKMIDRTECLMFLNTSNSLVINNSVEGFATGSPWLYSELTFSQLCRKKKLSSYRTQIRHDSMEASIPIMAKYDVCLSHLENLNDHDLLAFWENHGTTKSRDALDVLYAAKGIIHSGG